MNHDDESQHARIEAATPSTASVLDLRFAALGLLPGAAGALLLPEVPESERSDALTSLRVGDLDALPPAWGFLAQAARSEPVDASGIPEEVRRVNLAILEADTAGLIEGSRQTDNLELRLHLEATAYRLGADIDRPDPLAASDDYVRSSLHGTAAFEAATRGDSAGALTALGAATSLLEVTSPVAAARVTGEVVTLIARTGGPAASLLEPLERGIAILEGTASNRELLGDLLLFRAELLLALGDQQASYLTQALHAFQKCTQVYSRAEYPVPYALCQMNIAITYLRMPMNEHSSKLRAAIAVQSLRDALEIFTPDDQPGLWQAATLNLANALQHVPSRHVAENLCEAVVLYESVLAVRVDATIDRARVLANLGNALAHLGQFDDARARLAEARTLFDTWGDPGALEGIDGVLAEIEAREALRAEGGAAT